MPMWQGDLCAARSGKELDKLNKRTKLAQARVLKLARFRNLEILISHATEASGGSKVAEAAWNQSAKNTILCLDGKVESVWML